MMLQKMMTQKTNSARFCRLFIFVGLIFGGGFWATGARAQTVKPLVCITPNSRAGATTLSVGSSSGEVGIEVNAPNNQIPRYVRIVINPGSGNEESFALASLVNYDSGISSYYLNAPLTQEHSAGEIVQWFTDATAVWGYNNTGDAARSIPVGASNYLQPDAVPGGAPRQQPVDFAPGVHNAFSVDLPTRGDARVTWFLDGGQAVASADAIACGGNVISYQGRLTDNGSAANGIYDLRFVVFNQATGGAAQGEAVTANDAQVTNGVFTAPLDFGFIFYGNPNARFLEIGVRAGNSNGAFTTLAPRQPITSAPLAVSAQFAVNSQNAVNAQNAVNSQNAQNALNAQNSQNSQNAQNAARLNNVEASQYVLTTDPRLTTTNNTSFIQNSTAAQTGNFNITGAGVIGGNLTVGGTMTSGCRTGFTAFANGRLCVGAMKPAAIFLVAIQTCANDGTRVGNTGDVMLTIGTGATFNYFGSLPQGWLADYLGGGQWATWKVSFANADFAGAAANGTAAGPQLPYRCVY